MKNYKIIDNFLEYDDFIFIKSQIENNMFPWYYSGVLQNKTQSEIDAKYNFQFVHVFYKEKKQNSFQFASLNKLIEKIQPKCLLKVKANLNPISDKIVEHGYHVDFLNVTTCVFYVNSNNGYTKFQDGTVVNSLENRAVFFDSNLLHTGTTVTDQPYRIVLNINFME
jgi:hypothetical protein